MNLERVGVKRGSGTRGGIVRGRGSSGMFVHLLFG